MEDQLEEKDVLEMGAWSTEYDIAEEEEERLLEENDTVEGKHQLTYENEALFSDTEFETTEAEEDILDLGLSEDMSEYEETNSTSQESSRDIKKNSTTAHLNQNSETSPISQTQSSNTNLSRTSSIKVGQSQQFLKNTKFRRHPNFNLPVQMQTIPPPRMGTPRFYHPRPLFDGPSRPLIGRPPIVLDYQGARGGFMRHSMPLQCEPLFVQDFHSLPAQRFQRPAFRDHHLVKPNHFVEHERNSNINHLPISSHYQGLLTAQSGCKTRIPHLTEPRISFPVPDNVPSRSAFPGRHQRPPPGLHLNHRPTSYSPMRFTLPMQPNLPPPRLNGSADQTSPRFKPPPPQNLMDMILTPPFVDGLPRPSYNLEQSQPQRYRIKSFDPPSHTYDSANVRFLTPPPCGSKRSSSLENPDPGPIKQLRLGPTGNIQVLRTFPSCTTASKPSPSLTVSNTFPSKTSDTRQSLPSLPPPASSLNPPNIVSTIAPIAAVTVSTSTSGSLLSTVVPQTSVKSSKSCSDTTSAEMQEYLEKMEEQRKKREEVLRIKEERRRLKLASLDQSAEPISTQPGIVLNSDMPDISDMSKSQSCMKMNHPQHPQEEKGCALHPQSGLVNFKENNISPTVRKTVFVKPTPTVTTPSRTIPQAAVGVNRRYKVIIVKNKSGKILEKRRVPIDESPCGGNNNDSSRQIPFVTSEISLAGNTSARISETVTIENLNTNMTEDYVRKLCEMFGAVQDVYPKLQEGKAIVRFSCADGANNFLLNHNTPGICVRFL